MKQPICKNRSDEDLVMFQDIAQRMLHYTLSLENIWNRSEIKGLTGIS